MIFGVVYKGQLDDDDIDTDDEIEKEDEDAYHYDHDLDCGIGGVPITSKTTSPSPSLSCAAGEVTGGASSSQARNAFGLLLYPAGNGQPNAYFRVGVCVFRLQRGQQIIFLKKQRI